MKRIQFIALMAFISFLLSSLAWGQATVNESLETALIYVDARTGSDSNPGTQALPLKTISAAAAIAINNNQHRIGTRVTINPGTYRESISLVPGANDTNLPITFEAATSGTVIVSGSVLYTGWQPYSGNLSIFTDSWPHQWGLCAPDLYGPPEQDIVLRREMVFVNGTHLTQVLTLGQMRPGTFYVDESHATIYAWPRAGTNMSTASVEVATLPSLLMIAGRNDIVLRGLTFRYANPCRSGAAVAIGGPSTNILIDTDSFLWNNGQGLSFANPATNFTVQKSVANHNGAIGLQSYQVKNGLWQSDTANYNNWRGAQGAYYAWNSGGCHFFSEHNSTYNGLVTLFNQALGIHWDTDNVSTSSSSMLVSENLLSSILIEKSEGPMSISGSNLCNSNIGVHDQYLYGGGLTLRNSEFITVTGTTLLNNGTSQIDIQGQAGGILISNWETGQSYNLITQDFTSTHNIIEGVGASQDIFHDSYLGGSDWTAFVSTLASDNNKWWHASNSSAFTVPSPTLGTTVNFSGWQSATGKDAHSTFAAPSSTAGAACAVTPDVPDYWFVVDSASQTLSPSGTAVFNVAVIPFGFTGTVNLSFDGISEVVGLSASLNRTTINTSGSSALTVTASSTTTPGTYPITLIANSGNLTRTVTASLVVPGSSVHLSTTSLVFGSQQVNTTSPAQNVTLTNTGQSMLSITSIKASSNFGETNTCDTSVAAGTSCTISVTFTPASVGTITGSVTITDSDTTSPQVVNLSGTGTGTPSVKLSPNSEAYGNQVVKTTSAAKTVTLTNTGNGTLKITGITLTGTNPGDFAQTNNCGTSVAAGRTCTINLTFTPTNIRSRTATLNIADNTTSSPQKVSLTGTGVTAVALSKTGLTFAPQKVGTRSAPQTVTLTNNGTPLTVNSITIRGAASQDFAQTNTCGTSVAAGKTCTISVTFTPKATGTRAATVSISDSDPTSPQIITLTGTGQ